MQTLSEKIYNLIQPFVAQQTIVKRSVQDIEHSISEFIVIENDTDLIACCGVRKHQNINELYCLAVNENYHNQGYSGKILQKVLDNTTGDILALSKYQGEWFLKNGFTEVDTTHLPKTITYDAKRLSRIFIKYVNNNANKNN